MPKNKQHKSRTANPLLRRLQLAAACALEPRGGRRIVAAARDVEPSLVGTAGGPVHLVAAVADGESSTANDAPVAFTLEAYSGGPMHPQLMGMYWEGPIVVDVAGIQSDDVVPVHRDHDTRDPIGHASPTIAAGKVTADGVFSVDSESSREIIKSARRKFPWRASIGLGELSVERVNAGASVTVNGQAFNGPVLVVRQSRLNEISIVSVAGDPNTAANVAATHHSSPNPASEGTEVNFSAWLSANGHDETTLNASDLQRLHAAYIAASAGGGTATSAGTGAADDAANQNTPAGVNASGGRQHTIPAAATPPPTIDAAAAIAAPQLDLTAHRAAMAAETERVAAINAIGTDIGNPTVGDNGPALVAHAIREGWTVDATELYARRNMRPGAPAIHSTGQSERETVPALQAALMLRAGLAIDTVMPRSDYVAPWLTRPVNDAGRDAIMNAAHEFSGNALIDIVAGSLRAQGHTCPSTRNRHAVLRAAFSTHSVQAVFEQSIGSIALIAYAEASDFSAGWTSDSDELNLLPHERPRMKAAADLTQHPTGGTSNHVHREATSETVQVDRYSNQCTIDENDFINDNFGLLRDTPRDFGRAAARLMPSLVAAVLLSNPTLKRTTRAMFNTTDKSLGTGVLNQANLQAGRAMLARQKDGDASLNLPATHLIVPSTLGDLAIQLTGSAVITQDNGNGSMNPIQRRNITPVEEARLANGMTDPRDGKTLLAGSLTSWYLASAEGHTIERQFLAGTNRQPIVDVTPLAGTGECGLNIFVKHFGGASGLDCLSMVRFDEA